MNEKLETIRQVCIKANPEIVELKFGCELIRKDGGGRYIVLTSLGWGANDKRTWVTSIVRGTMHIDVENPNEIYKTEFTDSQQEKWEIIGRPIRLADVLLTIKNNQPGPRGHEKIHLCSEGMSSELQELVWLWKLLKDDLEDQSEETIDFIHSLLK